MKIAITACTGQLGSTIATHVVQSIGAENVIGISRNLE